MGLWEAQPYVLSALKGSDVQVCSHARHVAALIPLQTHYISAQRTPGCSSHCGVCRHTQSAHPKNGSVQSCSPVEPVHIDCSDDR
eukprot:scaffold407766_cov19-Prasinocladus_malaysianus.AAC.1